MGYTIENKQDAVVQSVLLTTEKTFAASPVAENSSNTQVNVQASADVYFQIED
ncbi:hypothetical protein [Polynucleobacter sp. JS-JIR-II-50]|uniref:hypothetical protein n=1 Tax=Polynucleobacter sp. JS-JIR-II-50 TaxID=2576919 RepID=UPI001BFEB4BB|nr:hypothetical protein [Polynucleobacter sp. JS-JIR-II-50]QWE04971.1 hypothetical protein FD963_02715 [Polynucleobacter sp. JS-JIR-II-50]